MVWRRARFLLELGVALALAIFGFELFIRSSGACQPAPFVNDDCFGRVMKPSTNVVFVNEGFRLGRINEYGYLGPAYPPGKNEDAVRIELMGDSYVAGREVFDRNHFRRILENRLNEVSPRPVQVINLGFPTATLERFYIYYETFGKKLCPDYILFFVGRTSLNWDREEVGPELVVEGDSLRIDYSFRNSRHYEMRKKLHNIRKLGLYWLCKKVRELNSRGETPHILLGKLCGLLGMKPPERDVDVEVPELNPKLAKINEAIVKKLAEMNRKGCPKPIVVSRDPLPESFVESVKGNGILYFDGAAVLDSLAQAGIDPRYWEGTRRRGHWNQYAHKAIGDFLADKMEPLIVKR